MKIEFSQSLKVQNELEEVLIKYSYSELDRAGHHNCRHPTIGYLYLKQHRHNSDIGKEHEILPIENPCYFSTYQLSVVHPSRARAHTAR